MTRTYQKILGYTLENQVIKLIVDDGDFRLIIVADDGCYNLVEDEDPWPAGDEIKFSQLRMRMPYGGSSEDQEGYFLAGLSSEMRTKFIRSVKHCRYMLNQVYRISDKCDDWDHLPEPVCKLWKEQLAPDTGRLIREMLDYFEKFIPEHLDRAAAQSYCNLDQELYKAEQAVAKIKAKKAAACAAAGPGKKTKKAKN